MKRKRSRPRSMTSPWRRACRVHELRVHADTVLALDVLDRDALGRRDDARVQPAQEAVVDLDVGDVGAADRHRFLVERVLDRPLGVEQHEHSGDAALAVARPRLGRRRELLREHELRRDHLLGVARCRAGLHALMQVAGDGRRAGSSMSPSAAHEIVERRHGRRVGGAGSRLVLGQRDRRCLHAVDARELLAQLVALLAHAAQLVARLGERAHRLLAARRRAISAAAVGPRSSIRRLRCAPALP